MIVTVATWSAWTVTTTLPGPGGDPPTLVARTVYTPGFTANVNRPAASVSIVDIVAPARSTRATWLRTGTVGQPVSGSTAQRLVTVVPVIAVRPVAGRGAGVTVAVAVPPDGAETVGDAAVVTVAAPARSTLRAAQPAIASATLTPNNTSAERTR
jgi:hypothetical protein